MTDRHIVALGGGGFSDAREATPLDRFVLSLSERRRPRVCFVPTASGDATSYVERFYAAFTRLECEPSHLSLFQAPYPTLPADLSSKDVVYVGGGSTANMLAVWRLHGVDRALRTAWEAGVVLCGISAGSLCWFGGGITDSFGELRAFTNGLGLLPGSNCPHYDVEPERRPAFHRAIAARELDGGYAADDGVALHFVGSELVEAVSEREHAAAYRVRGDRPDDEDRIEPRFLEVHDAAAVGGDER